MKIALGVGYYYPDSIGGTEKYIHDLAIFLLSKGIEVVVIAPSVKGNYSYQQEEGYTVHRFEEPQDFTKEEIRDKVICRGWENFDKLLVQLKPDIFHLHTISTSLSYRHLELAKQKGIKTLFTAHIPGVICPKGDFIKYPNEVCNGKVSHANCGSCHAHWRHQNIFTAKITGKLAQSSRISSLLKKNISQFEVIHQRKTIFQALQDNTSYIIAVCQWLYDAFLINGIHAEKLRICRQGVSTNYMKAAKQERKLQEKSLPIKIGFIGRLEPIKGLHVLLDVYEKTIQKNPNLQIELHIVGVKQDFYSEYYNQLQQKIQSLPNTFYQEKLPAEQVSDFIAGLDYLCIPSVCLETGPIVAYEAFTNQVPIIGANIGGVAELVEDGKTGFLYQFDDLSTFENILLNVATHPSLTNMLSKNIVPPRTTQKVGEEMLNIYESLF